MVRNYAYHLAVLSLLVVSPVSALADYQRGRSAFQAGDYAATYREWIDAADRGDADARFGIGELYRQGLGVGADISLAAAWYRRAATQGHVGAILALAEMHLTGNGARRDAVRAWQLFDQAAGLGSAWGANRARRVWSGLSAYQRAATKPD